MNETMKTLIERRSCKKYLSTPVEQELIDEVIKAGTYAPTGRNRQPVKILVITDTQVRDELRKLNAKFMGVDESFDPFYNAPVVLVVLSSPAVSTYLYDGSLVMGNMMNAAHALGLVGFTVRKKNFKRSTGKVCFAPLVSKGSGKASGIVFSAIPTVICLRRNQEKKAGCTTYEGRRFHRIAVFTAGQ